MKSCLRTAQKSFRALKSLLVKKVSPALWISRAENGNIHICMNPGILRDFDKRRSHTWKTSASTDNIMWGFSKVHQGS